MSQDDDLDDGGLPPLTPEEEREMESEIEIALAPYVRVVPASLLPMLRESLAHSLRTHPVPRQLLRGLVARPVPDESGTVRRDGAPLDDGAVRVKEGA